MLIGPLTGSLTGKLTGAISSSPIAFDYDAVLFMQRVVADGGTVEDAIFLDSFVKNAKANGYFGDIVAAYSPSWGVKGPTTASKLYSLIGAGQDIEQAVAASQPAITAGSLNGKTRLVFDGADDFFTAKSFTLAQPETVILGGFCNTVHADNNNIHDGFNQNSMLLLQTFVSGQIRTNAGVAGPSYNLGLGADNHVRELLNGVSSALQIDSVAEVTGDAGVLDGDGFTLGGRNDGANPAEFKTGMVVLLKSAVDANYDAKMAAIYNFSKNVYGTP